MPANIETFENGSAGFVSAREDAWHQLGMVLDHNFSAAEAMEYAHLGNWNVRKVPLQAVEDDNVIDIAGVWATVRNNPVSHAVEPLGTVGNVYRTIQNEEHAGFLDAMVDESGAHFETAGSLNSGRQVFVTMKLPKTIKVGGVDEVNLYLAALNSHDGTTAFRVILTPVRIVCENTQRWAIREAVQSFSIRHTTNATQRVAQARDVLGMTFESVDAFEAEAEKMIQAELNNQQFTRIIKQLFLKPKRTEASAVALKNYNEKMGTLKYLFTEADTQAQIRNTRWAGYQSVAEYLDHCQPVRGSKDGSLAAAQRSEEIRALKSLTHVATVQAKEKAFSAFAVN